MIEVMRHVLYVGKTQTNTEGGRYKFRGIDDVTAALGPALREHGILTLPEVIHAERQATKTTRGKDTRETVLRVRFTITDEDGDSLTIITEGESLDTGDKGTAKAMSVAWRTALIIAYSLPTDEPDPDSFSYERGDYRDDDRDERRDRRERPRRGRRDDDRDDERGRGRADDRSYDEDPGDRAERNGDRWRGRPTMRDHFGTDDERAEGADRRRQAADPDRVNAEDADPADDLVDTSDPEEAAARALLGLKDKLRHYKINKAAAADVFADLFGEELPTADAVIIDKFAELIIAVGGLPQIDKAPAEQHPMVLRLIKVRDAVTEVEQGSATEQVRAAREDVQRDMARDRDGA
jgi:hypothetical protein